MFPPHAAKHRAVVELIGRRATLQLGCLYAAGALLQVVRYRGMSTLSHYLGTKVFDKRNSIILRLNDVSRFKLLLRDGYWINMLFSDFDYEPEIAFVLSQALGRPDICFIDCGANIGYWSIVASTAIAAPGRTLAIEASPPQFRLLAENATLNRNRFKCMNLAVWSHDGESLEIVTHDRRHAGSSVVSRRDKKDQAGYRVDQVRSITLDALLESHVPPNLDVILKLDVEGAEVAALQGARKLLTQHRPLVIYEDHGNDPTNSLSQYVLHELSMEVFYCSDDLVVSRVDGIEAIRRIKVDKTRGYNFFASSPESCFAALLSALEGTRDLEAKG